ncbi:glycyl-radical enzyme activating protein [Anaerostipes sp.]|uniref:glycyl-radical enzyme activating protein n=1 Tax=Anaerostipes sp. TaxID=1872530 RepID=UPI0025BD721B|nr:glycyl-radical enzyme activating protein [Anaerostipes sp.]MBS7008811.1 glycyl-radical enzyme activating protein [Anaerostipes sp.]
MKSKKTGIITEIERYAIKDGPGIRTVVFFKGCPLQCRWCANPETQKTACQLMYWKTRCLGCKKCIDTCPECALSFGAGGVEIDRDKCSLCGQCADVCNSQALTTAGENRSVDEIMEVILKDKIYYQTSGGGVTFSGGEAASQGDFLCELAKACKEHQISSCIETCGYAAWETYKKILPYIDCFFYDLKIMDEEEHKRFTGVSNRLILDNFCRLIEAGTEVTVRIPVIPGVNNTDENINNTISFLMKNAPDCQISLLPYHRLGVAKYEKLDQKYSLGEILPPSDEEIKVIEQRFKEKGFYVTVGE